jgi:hypothetical protein
VVESVSPASSSDLPPTALAVAVFVEALLACAETLTAPVAVSMLRSMVALATSFNSTMPTAAPTAAFSPCALPLALVVVLLAWSTSSVTAPGLTSVEPVPNRAVVVLLTMASATAGVIAMPPLAPASTSVSTA